MRRRTVADYQYEQLVDDRLLLGPRQTQVFMRD